MASAAYGFGRDSIVSALAEGCPVRHSSPAVPVPGGLPGEECLTPHAPSEKGCSFASGSSVGMEVQMIRASATPSTHWRHRMKAHAGFLWNPAATPRPALRVGRGSLAHATRFAGPSLSARQAFGLARCPYISSGTGMPSRSSRRIFISSAKRVKTARLNRRRFSSSSGTMGWP